MPLSALVTPATLTIVPSSNVTSNDRALVPSIDFDKSAVFSGNGTNYGVAPLLSRIAGPAITGATILPMRPVHSNSAYDLTFQGPSLYCQTADNATTASIDEGFGVLATRVTPNDYVPIYVAFSPGTDTVDGDDGTTYVANASQTVADCILGSDPLCAYTSKAGDNPIFLRLGKERLFCSLQDTTFNAHFSASGNNQYVTETNYTWIGPAASGSYTSYAQALVNILNGGISGGNPLPGNAAHANDSNVFMTLKTRIMETALVSLVVDAMTDTLSRQQYADQLWDIPTITEADRALAQNKSLATLVEEMSRNVTLSLFSDNQYWHAYPSPPLPRVFTNLHPRSSQPQTSNVTTTTPVNRYAYASRNLFLAYGIAFFTTLVCVLTGLRALFVNEGSRDMTFSTIMTVTRNPTLDELIQEQSAKDVSETQLRFGALQSRDEGGARRKRHLGFGLPTEVMVQRKGEDFVIVNRK
ncbi:hypothetical protein H2203_002246 [Taxawa tesnikishii (nom. ined.)]|nr:hypothetical protein H2203_002246 [Dothideales sp. JES 119]